MDAQDPFPAGQSVNIRSIFWYTNYQFQCRSALPNLGQM